MATNRGRLVFHDRRPGGRIVRMTSEPENRIRIVVRKSERKLDVFEDEQIVRSCDIALGNFPEGTKTTDGDGRTPEGEYFIFTKNDQSKYHLSLAISYPGIQDAARGFAEGIINQSEYDSIVDATAAGKRPPQNTALGGEIYIHGGGSSEDWTRGCVAIANGDIEAIFNAVQIGTKVTILP